MRNNRSRCHLCIKSGRESTLLLRFYTVNINRMKTVEKERHVLYSNIKSFKLTWSRTCGPAGHSKVVGQESHFAIDFVAVVQELWGATGKLVISCVRDARQITFALEHVIINGLK